MPLEHVLAVFPVADFEAAQAWYERLFGRPADNLPMAGRLVEWQVTDGWGSGHPRHRPRRSGPVELRRGRPGPADHRYQRGSPAPGAIETVHEGVQLCAVTDPYGNRVTFIGNFRVQYAKQALSRHSPGPAHGSCFDVEAPKAGPAPRMAAAVRQADCYWPREPIGLPSVSASTHTRTSGAI
jgi:glyoxylase I family protein